VTQQSTCDRSANKSAYWVLQVYVDGISLRPKKTGVYYSSKGGLDPLKTENTPLGVKVIAKYPYIAPSAQEAAEVDWYCSNGNSPHNIPTASTSNRLRAQRVMRPTTPTEPSESPSTFRSAWTPQR
jgi:hypothetical protein